MSGASGKRDDRPYDDLNQADASRLLHLGLTGPPRPVDQLINRMSTKDGHTWLRKTLETGPTAAFGPPVAQLVEGAATLDQLVTMKQSGKSLAGSSCDDQSTLAAMVCYFFPIASAMVHHGRNICSRSRDELNVTLLDLATVAPEPWADLLSRAALVEERSEPTRSE
jgi:hypothetical protein